MMGMGANNAGIAVKLHECIIHCQGRLRVVIYNDDGNLRVHRTDRVKTPLAELLVARPLHTTENKKP